MSEIAVSESHATGAPTDRIEYREETRRASMIIAPDCHGVERKRLNVHPADFLSKHYPDCILPVKRIHAQSYTPARLQRVFSLHGPLHIDIVTLHLPFVTVYGNVGRAVSESH